MALRVCRVGFRTQFLNSLFFIISPRREIGSSRQTLELQSYEVCYLARLYGNNLSPTLLFYPSDLSQALHNRRCHSGETFQCPENIVCMQGRQNMKNRCVEVPQIFLDFAIFWTIYFLTQNFCWTFNKVLISPLQFWKSSVYSVFVLTICSFLNFTGVLYFFSTVRVFSRTFLEFRIFPHNSENFPHSSGIFHWRFVTSLIFSVTRYFFSTHRTFSWAFKGLVWYFFPFFFYLFLYYSIES